MRSFTDSGLILVVLALGGLVAGSGIKQTPMAAFGRRGRDNAADPTHGLGRGSHAPPIYWVLVLSAWGAAALAAAVLGWSAFPGEVRALALAAMLTVVVSRLVVTVLFIAPIVLSEQRLATTTPVGAGLLYRRWQLRRTFLDAIALLVTGVALVLTISG